MKFDYGKLRGKIKEKFNTQNAFADAMGVSAVTISDKLNNKVQWTQKEMDMACSLLDIDSAEIPIYFFTVKVKEL